MIIFARCCKICVLFRFVETKHPFFGCRILLKPSEGFFFSNKKDCLTSLVIYVVSVCFSLRMLCWKPIWLYKVIHSLFASVSTRLIRTPLTDTTTCELPPRTKSTLGPVPLCTTRTTAPLQEHQGAQRLSVVAPEAREPLPAEERLPPRVPSPPPDARKPATTLGRLPDCLTSATPSSTRSRVPGKASSPRLTPPQRPRTSPGTVAFWTPLPSWPTTTTDTPRTTRPTAWASRRPAWPLWRPAPPTRCTGSDLGWRARGSESAPGAPFPLDQRRDWESTAAPLASLTPRSTLTTLTAGTRSECRLTCESGTQSSSPFPSPFPLPILTVLAEHKEASL